MVSLSALFVLRFETLDGFTVSCVAVVAFCRGIAAELGGFYGHDERSQSVGNDWTIGGQGCGRCRCGRVSALDHIRDA